MKMKFVNDFKQFAMRGNVVDMTVGIIAGQITVIQPEDFLQVES